MMSHIQPRWLGLQDYHTVWDLQKKIASQIQNTTQGVLLGCEHPTTITLGHRLKEKPFTCAEIPVVSTDRGGLATLHSPGQLILYPMVSLRVWQLGVREWISLLLTVTEAVFRRCNIIIIDQNNGLFTKNGKIASIGIAVHRGVSHHGLALNLSNDLGLFSVIQACGVQNQAMDRAKETLDISTEAFFKLWVEEFKMAFQKQAEAKSLPAKSLDRFA